VRAGDRRHELFHRGEGWQDNLPGPEDRLGAGDEITWEQVIRGTLGQPCCDASAGGLIKGTPTQVLPDALELLGLCGQPSREFPKQHGREI
jgi:hypothetical protein